MADRPESTWLQRLGEALDEMSAAYAEARRLVFDRYPPGVRLDDERLSPEERHALRRFHAAEHAVRQRSWESAAEHPMPASSE